jgi:hypothetical protein
MIRHIFKKDWALLWPLAALVTAIQIAFEWTAFKSELATPNPVAVQLVLLLANAWMVGLLALTVAVIHEDPIPGAEQDWLVRPLRRTDLLLAKLLFILVTVITPMLVLNLAHGIAAGFVPQLLFKHVVLKELYVFVCLIVPAMALASTTRNMTDLFVLAAGLIVLYAASLWLSAIAIGADRCPTCASGLSWQQHLLQHAGILAGSAIILGLQYYGRLTNTARAVAAIGVVLLVFAQLPWNFAFAVQSRLSGSAAAAAAPAVGLQVDLEAEGATGAKGNGTRKPPIIREVTRALLQGNVDAAVMSLRQLGRPPDAPVLLDLPLRISGLAQDQMLLLDRTDLRLRDAAGRVLYQGKNAAGYTGPLIPDSEEVSLSPGLVHQIVAIPVAIYRQARPRAAQLQLEYSLTLVSVGAQHELRALNGELRAPDLGLCRSRWEKNNIQLRCQQLGPLPFCYSATLYAPDGRHNPAVLECAPDYRPAIPPISNVLYFAGTDLPISDPSGLAHYPVDVAELPQARVVFQVYAARDHFRRTVELPLH